MAFLVFASLILTLIRHSASGLPSPLLEGTIRHGYGASTTEAPTLLLHVTDLHVSAFSPGTRAADLIALAEQHLRHWRPDAIIVTGAADEWRGRSRGLMTQAASLSASLTPTSVPVHGSHLFILMHHAAATQSQAT